MKLERIPLHFEEAISMNIKDLKHFFKEHLVPKKYYKIGKEHKNRICLIKSTDGWDIFFKDDKEKVGTQHYSDESSACVAMMNEIRKLMESANGLTWARR